MKFTFSWLKEYLDTTASLDEIVNKLTALGLEVESVSDKAASLAAFRVAQITEATQHPDADRLRVCRVNTGLETLQIVCGAPNARAGIYVVLAPVGTVIPGNGMQIKASKIRGVDSNGMLCSGAELGLDENSEGIIEITATDADLGKKFVDLAGLNDPIIEIAITPNRGDCLGVYGIARDLAASGVGRLKDLDTKRLQGDFASPINVTIANNNACPLFVGRYFKNVKNGPSPKWLQDRLQSIGVKSISTLVDITNYITFAFGRPLHVYDASKITGNLCVRFAHENEKFTGLDNKEYNLKPDFLTISDDRTAQALGGVIGGLQSGCQNETTEVFLEVALFNPDVVTKTGRMLDIITDSRYRFERQVDPGFVHNGAEIATQMILDLCGGQASELVIAGGQPENNNTITLPHGFIEKYSGVAVNDAEITAILQRLGFEVKSCSQNSSHSFVGTVYQVPSWRPDVHGPADLVEEVLRIYGYDKIPTLALPAGTVAVAENKRVHRSFKLQRFLAARGLFQVVTWSFMAQSKAELFASTLPELYVQNPISSELDYMRPCIIANLLDAVARNDARGNGNLAIFEIGPVFANATVSGQSLVVAGVLSGEKITRNIHDTPRNVDVFDAKAECLAVLGAAGAPVASLIVARGAPAYYHPGKSGIFKLGKNVLGVFGQLHPAILKKFSIKLPVMAFEVMLDNIPEAKARKSTARPKLEKSDLQSSRRDFAFMINDNILADQIVKTVENIDKSLICDVDLFDVYQGKNIEAGKKSVAFGVKIQPVAKNLTEGEIEELSNKVIKAVESLGGALRK